MLRTNAVSTNDTLGPLSQLCFFQCCIDLTVPTDFDAGAGDYLTFSFTLDTDSTGDFPDTFEMFADFLVYQLNGEALNLAPYVASGYSYTVGRQFWFYGDMLTSWNTLGPVTLNHASPGQTEFATNQALTDVTAGSGGFTGEGVIIGGLDTEVAGWNWLRNSGTTHDTSKTLIAGSVFTLVPYLQVLPSDFSNPDRTMFMKLLSASMTWVPFSGSPVTTTIDLSTAQVGFNTGAVAAPGEFGPYTYSALRSIEDASAPESSVYQDLFKVPVDTSSNVPLPPRSPPYIRDD